MSKERTPQEWLEDIKLGQRFQVMFGQMNDWPTYKDYYRHKFGRGRNSNALDILPVNVVFSILNSLVAQTYIKSPSVTVTQTKPGVKNFFTAKVRESLARYFLRERRTKLELKRNIKDNFLCGIGYIWHGYDSEYGFASKYAEDGAPATLTQFDSKGYRVEYNTYINPGMPWAMRTRPDDVVWPWGTDRANNAPWVALRKIRELDDLKRDKKYTVPSDMGGTYSMQRGGVEGMSQKDALLDTIHSAKQYVEIWQIHDLRTGNLYVVSEGVDKFLRKETDEMQIDGLPVTTTTFSEDPDWIYGIPDTRVIEPQLLELIETRTQAMKHRRVDIVKMLVKKGALKPDAINKMTDEDVKAVVEIEVDEDIRTVVQQLTGGVGGTLQELGFAAELTRQDIREMVGFSSNQTGEFQGKSHVTAKEVGSVMQKSDIRIDERRDMIADLLTDIVRKDLQTVDKFWTTRQVTDIIGPDGARWWVEFSGPEIRGEYNYEIDPNSDDVLTPDQKKNDAIQMAQAWAQMNAGQVSQGAPVPAEIQRWFFSQFKGINIEKLLGQQGIQEQVGSQERPLPLGQAAQMMQQKMQGGQ